MSFGSKVVGIVFVLGSLWFSVIPVLAEGGNCASTCSAPAGAVPSIRHVANSGACTALCQPPCVAPATCTPLYTPDPVTPSPNVCLCGCTDATGSVSATSTQSCVRVRHNDPACVASCGHFCTAGTTAPDVRVRPHMEVASAGCALRLEPAASPDTTPSSPSAPPPTNAGRNAIPITLSQPIDGVTVVADMGNYIAVVFRYVIGLAGTATVIMIVYGGFLYLLGSAMSDVSKGKQIIQDAIIGLLLVLGSYTILATVNPNTLSLKLPNIQTIVPVALPADPRINHSNQGCNEDANCGLGKVCLLHAKAGCAGGYCGSCTDGSSGMRCRCTGPGCGADPHTYEPGPANNNFHTNDVNTDYPCKAGLRCAAVADSIRGDSEYVCVGGTFSVCNVHRDPHVECTGTGDDWNYCWQRDDSSSNLVQGICLYGTWRDDAYRAGTGEVNMTDADRGNCTGIIDAGARSSLTQKCRDRDGLVCTTVYRPFLDLFHTTNALYGTNPVPSGLKGFNFFRKGCRKNISATCASDEECPAKCVEGHCTGFCFITTHASVTRENLSTVRVYTGQHNIPGEFPAPNFLASACSDNCGENTTWSFIHTYLDYVWNTTGPDVDTKTGYYIAALGSIGGFKNEYFNHSACFSRRATGQKCDFPFQCQSNVCNRSGEVNIRITPATFNAPMDVNVGAGTCG